ncbi:MAG: Holliday junction DNA helicase RuvA [Candidatus Omnitrophica bacterium]|nr:Holliday junction DNA helicase RuvA [Candidatus Omnitrophota bacterium]
MICRISGKIIGKEENSVLLEVNGIGYEVLLPQGIMRSLAQNETHAEFVTYHYYQTDPSKSIPILVGFLNEVEKEFFEKFITVSGIGPKAAVRAISEPISDIARAIDSGDVNFLKALPGIGNQRAREIVAKLQGKVGKFGLIRSLPQQAIKKDEKADIEQEALSVLLQLQYKRPEAETMIKKAMERNPQVKNAEELLNEVYRQRSAQSE